MKIDFGKIDNKLVQYIEALIFTSEQPLSKKDIVGVLEEHFESSIKEEDVDEALAFLEHRYSDPSFALEIHKIGGGYQFFTKGAYHECIGVLLKQNTTKRLSRAAMETLSIIVYKQPVVKSEIESIRGVSADYSIHKLLEKELVEIAGRSEGPGKPLQYRTTDKFMDYFGINSLDEMPKPKDFKEVENQIGEKPAIEEEVVEGDVAPKDEEIETSEE